MSDQSGRSVEVLVRSDAGVNKVYNVVAMSMKSLYLSVFLRLHPSFLLEQVMSSIYF